MELGSDIWAQTLLHENLFWVLPEVGLVAAMCAVILVPFVRRDAMSPVATAALGLLAALGLTLWTTARMGSSGHSVFTGMLAVDYFSQFFRQIFGV